MGHHNGGGGGGSTEVLFEDDFLAAADGGGGGAGTDGGGGGGARGGDGGSGNYDDGQNASGTGFGGNGGDADYGDGEPGGQEAGSELIILEETTGGSTEDSDGDGYVEITYVESPDPPNFNSKSVIPDPLEIDGDTDVLFNVSDSDNEGIDTVQVLVEDPDGNEIASRTESYSSDSVQDTFTALFNPGKEGTYTIEFEATDDAGLTTTESLNKNIDSNLQVQTNPAENIGFTSATLVGEITELDQISEVDVFLEYREANQDDWEQLYQDSVTGAETFSETVEDLDHGTEYEFRALAEAGDVGDTGAISSFETDNEPPEINSAQAIIDQSSNGEQLDFVLDDNGFEDITDWSGTGTTDLFTNSSLVLDVAFPVTQGFTVTDIHDETSETWQVNFSYVESSLDQRSQFNHDLSTQRVNRDAELSNDADQSIEYEYIFASQGETSIQEVFTGTLDIAETTSETGIWEGDWIANIEEQTFDRFEDTSFDHDTGTQRLVNQTQLVVDNQQDFPFSDVDLSSECSNTASGDVDHGNDNVVTTDCNTPTFQVDFIDTSLGDQVQDTAQTSNLTTQFLERETQLEETGGYAWTQVTVPPPSMDGDCSDCSERDLDFEPDEVKTETYNSEGDWISNVTEDTEEKFPDSTADHTEDEQVLINQTQLIVDNDYSIEFSDVDITGQCSNTETQNIEPGQEVEVTSNCNTPSFNLDFIDVSVLDVEQDHSQGSTLEQQHITQEKEFEEIGGYDWTQVTLSAPSIPGTCSDCDNRERDVDSGQTISEEYHSSGDWIEEVSTSSKEYVSDRVIYGSGIEQNVTADQALQGENTLSADLDVDINDSLTFEQGCVVAENTEKLFESGSTASHKVEFGCLPGEELSWEPVQVSEDATSVDYNYTANISIYSDLLSEEEHNYAVPKSRLDNWIDRDPELTEVAVEGNSNNISVEEEVVNDEEYVLIVVGDEHGNSSLYEGSYTVEMTYSESKDVPGGGGGGSTTIIEEVRGDYEWNVFLEGANEDQRSLEILSGTGQTFERNIVLENTGDRDVSLEINCESNDGSCDWIQTDLSEVELNTDNFTTTQFTVEGTIPLDADSQQYQFWIEVTDPSHEEGTNDGVSRLTFNVNMNPVLSRVIGFVDQLSGWTELPAIHEDAETLRIPFFLIPLASSLAAFIGLSLGQQMYRDSTGNQIRRSNGLDFTFVVRLMVAALVFVLVTGVAA